MNTFGTLMIRLERIFFYVTSSFRTEKSESAPTDCCNQYRTIVLSMLNNVNSFLNRHTDLKGKRFCKWSMTDKRTKKK